MGTVTIDMRPEPFELPFFYTQLDILAKNRLNLWQKEGRALGEGSIFIHVQSGMVVYDENDGLCPEIGPAQITKRMEDALHHAKDFIEYHERYADRNGGLKLDDCHEWGNAKSFDGGRQSPRSLLYGIRLSYNDGSVRIFTITSKLESEL